MKSTTQPQEYSPDDFLWGRALGEGRFGSVLYAELKDTSPSTSTDDADLKPSAASAAVGPRRQGYAIKTITKSEVLKHDHLQIVMTEKHILTEVLHSDSDTDGSDMLMKLLLLFHDKHCIYFVLELCAGGTLHDLIQTSVANISDGNAAVMDVPSWARYYAGQLLRAIEFMHQRGVVHRDISPQNIGLTLRGEIKLGDFGAAAVFVKHDCGDGTFRLKRWVPPGSRPLIEEFDNFVGTADYVSPEMIRGNIDHDQSEGCHECPAMDLWAYGCIIYELFIGKSPFHAGSDHVAFQSVLDYANGKRKMFFPPAIPIDAANIISPLLSNKPSDRLGMQDRVMESSILQGTPLAKKQYQSIRGHAFFQIDKDTSFWALVDGTAVEPPYKPAPPNWMADLALKPLEQMRFDL